MYRLFSFLIALVSAFSMVHLAFGQIHPKESLGRKIFDSFRQNKFSDFYLRSIFSLEEAQFRDLLYGIENLELREKLTQFYKLDYPANAQTCLLYTSPSPRDATLSRMPSSA